MEITKEEFKKFRNYLIYDIETVIKLSGIETDKVKYMFYHYDELDDKYPH